MKTRTRRATVLVATGALGLGGLAIAAPALAGANPFGQPTVAASGPGPGWRGGDGAGAAMNRGTGTGSGVGMGSGVGTMARDGSCLDPAVTAAKGTLTDQQKSTLAAIAQEEKLAHDLYVAFAGRYDVTVFDRIAAAETQHLTTVRTLLDRYGLADPTADKPAGQFSDPAVQATYDRLLTQGQASQAAALQVGVTVEQTDIDDLRSALSGLTAPDVKQVYTRLLAASQHHLTAVRPPLLPGLLGRWSTS